MNKFGASIRKDHVHSYMKIYELNVNDICKNVLLIAVMQYIFMYPSKYINIGNHFITISQ